MTALCTLNVIGDYICHQLCLLFQVKANPSKKPILSLPSRKLNKEQAAVLGAVLSGKNIFFTGSAGKSKTENLTSCNNCEKCLSKTDTPNVSYILLTEV